MKFSKSRRHSLGSATVSLAYSSCNPGFFSARRKLARPFWQANGKWEMSHVLASETLQLSYGGEECQKKKNNNNLHFPRREGSSSGSHSNSQRLGSPAVGQPEALTPTPGTTEMIRNFPPTENTQKVGRERSKQCPEREASEHFPHEAPSPHDHLTSLCAPGPVCSPLWAPVKRRRTQMSSAHTHTHTRARTRTTHSLLAFA